MGTSLSVQPGNISTKFAAEFFAANKLPIICLNQQTPLVVVNKGETSFDPYATLVVDRPSGEFMKEVIAQL
jgi:NAD-dependent SIR2 family protein deacetylase